MSVSSSLVLNMTATASCSGPITQTALWFQPLELRLLRAPPPEPILSIHGSSSSTIVFVEDVGEAYGVKVVSQLHGSPQMSHASIPSKNNNDDDDDDDNATSELFVYRGRDRVGDSLLVRTMFKAVLHQWHSLCMRFACARSALFTSVKRFCPFPPLLAAVHSIHRSATFEEVLQLPSWMLEMVHDFLLAFLRAMLPALVAEEVLGLKINLAVAKLLLDGNLADTIMQEGASNLESSISNSQMIPEERSMDEVALLEKELFNQEMAWELNVTDGDSLVVEFTEHTLVVLKAALNKATPSVEESDDGAHYACVAITKLMDPPVVFVPDEGIIGPDSVAATYPVLKAAIGLHELTASAINAALLKDLDVSCFVGSDERDTRVMQLDVIVVDCSGSMSSLAFSNDQEMRRSDAAQILFNMVVDKYRTLELNVQVACVLFGSSQKKASDFTNDLAVFETLLGRASNMGGTALWDALVMAAEALVDKRRELLTSGNLHPQCRLRILAVTDGQDNQSKYSNLQVAQLCRKHDILIDAFMLGNESDTSLRTCAHATGGHTLLFLDIQDATELFELPYVVCLSARHIKEDLPIVTDSKSFSFFSDLTVYPRITSTTARNAATEATQATKTSNPTPSTADPSSSSRSSHVMKRLAKEMDLLRSPKGKEVGVVAVDITNILRPSVLLKGPAGTLYENSFLVLHLNVPSDFPFHPAAMNFASEHKLFHPQIVDTKVCSDVGANWSPNLSLLESIKKILEQLLVPNTSHAINNWACSLYQTDRAAYDAEVRKTLPNLTEAAARALQTDWIDLA